MASSDSTYLVAFKDYIKSTPNSREQREEMEREFYADSDRACGILQASWVELMVDRAVRARLRREGSSEIFDANGPLGTFSSKIMMAYGLGIFGDNTRHDLRLIRTMRNGFAHCQLPLRFKEPAVKGMCDHLALPDIERVRAVPLYLFDRFVEGGGEWHDQDHPRERYIVCCYTIISGIFRLFQQPNPPLVPGADLP
jgi:hypothetical protein